MRVIELAQDLKVDSEQLIALLRSMRISVSDEDDSITAGQMAKVLARVERERRGGDKTAEEAIEAALEEARSGSRRRRRRRKADLPDPEPEEEEDADDDAEEDEAVDESDEEPEGDAEEDAEEVEDDADEVEAEADDEDSDEPEEDTVVEDAEESDGEDVEEPVDEAEDEDEDVEDAATEAEDADAEGTGEDEADEDEEEAPQKPTPASAGAKDKKSTRTIRRPTPAASAGPGGKVRIQAEGYTSDGRRQRRNKGGRKRKRPDKDAVQENIQRVMAEIKGGGSSGGSSKKKRRKSQRVSAEEEALQEEIQREEEEREAKTIKVNEFLTVSELAELMDISASKIIGSAFKNLGLMVTINQRLDFDQIELLLDEFGFTAEKEEQYEAEAEVEEEEEDPESLKPRGPVVTVMGHVDHGKTLLLDRIRDANVVAGEAGGITQHIGAYHVEVEDRGSLTFLDTPGHAAFTAMRARGADVTDIVILLVAADDSVMPQTIEAISHAKNAGVPLVVAINKCDLPAADPMRVKQELLQHEVNVEDFGGTVLVSEVSAMTGKGIEDLLEKVLLQAELLELKANPDREAVGTVVEAELDVGKGAVVTVLVQKGTLHVGDDFLVGQYDGRVRAMLDERGNTVSEAGPGIPVQVLGAGGVPQAGDAFQVMDADRAGEIASTRQRLEREKQLRVKERGLKLGDFSQLVASGQTATLPLVIKGDVDGSVQALSDALEQIGTDEVQVEVIHRAVGAVNESDVLLAETAGAIILGFRVRPQTAARQEAERADVEIKTYDVIYNAVDDITAALEGMLSPEEKETIEGSAEVRETFRVSRVGTIAGCYVQEGRIARKGRARLVRDGIVVYDGEIGSLKRFKDDVKEVREGFECGIGIENFNDVKVGDVIECYTVEEVARTLAGAS